MADQRHAVTPCLRSLNQTLPLPQRGSPQQAQPLERPQGRFMRSSSLRRDNRPKSTFG